MRQFFCDGAMPGFVLDAVNLERGSVEVKSLDVIPAAGFLS